VRASKLFITLISTFVFAYSAVASQCNVYKDLATKEFPDQFWEELAKIDPTDKVKVDALLARYDVTKKVPGTSASVTSVGSGGPGFTISHKAKTAIKNLRSNPTIQKKFDDFLEVANGGFDKISAFAADKAPGWKLHPLVGEKNMFTIRLDQGKRVQFKKLVDGGIEIIDVGRQVSH